MSDAPRTLTRTVGLPGAVLLGLGSIVGTGVFVSLGLAAGIAGEGILVALPLAAILALVNGLSSAQLAAAFPVAGGTYEYAYRTLGPWWGRAAGWTFLLAKTASMATAARGFAGYVVSGVPALSSVPIDLLAVLAVAAATLLTASGVKRTNFANALIVTATLVGLAAFVVVALIAEPTPASAAETPWSATDLLKATAFLFVAYTGYGRIATLGEEVKDPAHTIPRAVVVTLVFAAVVYFAVGFSAVRAVGTESFAAAARGSGASLARLSFELGQPQVAWLVSIASVTAMLGVQLNLSLGLSRVVLAMARRRDVPEALGALTGDPATPRAAVLLVGVVTAVLVLLFDIKGSWTFSAGTVLVYYAITNLAATRLPPAQRRLPVAFAWLGLAACAGLALVTIWLW